jgi:hypothetical protein
MAIQLTVTPLDGALRVPPESFTTSIVNPVTVSLVITRTGTVELSLPQLTA